MCGIVGAAGDLDIKAREVFEDLLVICQLRGRDSTGVIRVAGNNDVYYAKEVGTPDRLFDTRLYDKVIDVYDTKALIGHCRAKTNGVVSRRNAHPFDFPSVIGVHNGTLNHSWRTGKDAQQFDVDSEWLYSRIDELGVREAIREEIDDRGAWALVFWDKEDDSLCFLRNTDRPLSFCWNKDKTQMFWASEPWMLCAVKRAMDVAILDEETDEWTMSLPVNQLWQFKITRSKVKTFTAKPMEEVVGKRFFIPPPANKVADFRGSAGGAANKGGSGVIHPFQRAKEEDEKKKGQKQLPLLPQGKGASPVGNGNTSASGQNSGTNSSSTSGQVVLSPPSPTPTRPTLSVVQNNSNGYRITSKNTSSSVCAEQLETLPSGKTHNLSDDVSIRKVAGIWYIHSKTLNAEMTEAQFESNTGAICDWCHNPIGSIVEVQFFFTANKFCCSACAL